MTQLVTPRLIETAFWLIVLSALAAGIGFETDWGRRWSSPIAAPEDHSAAFSAPSLTPLFNMPAADTFLEIAMRPLFVHTRRPAPPPPPPVAVVTKPQMQKGQFVLTGTTIVAEGRYAHLKEKAANKSHVVPEGKEINGILVQEVNANQVVLTQHEDTEIVMLVTGKSQVPSANTPTNPNPKAPTNPEVSKETRPHAWPGPKGQ